MKKVTSILRYVFMLATALLMFSCVHDDKYDTPDTEGFQCGELTKTLSIADVKAKYTTNGNQTFTFPADSKDIMEGYVSSSDDTGNIYKYIYIQDTPKDPTEGFTLSVNSLNNYSRYPQGAKIYIKLAGLSVGTYGGVIQLGAMGPNANTGVIEFGRIPEETVYSSFLRSCEKKQIIVPKEITLAQMLTGGSDKLLGSLIKIKDAEFTQTALCNIYAPNGLTVDRPITDASTNSTAIVRNSGFASFASKVVPAGKGDFVGIMSKYNSSYQMYIVRDTDFEMKTFPRKDGITSDPCAFDPQAHTRKTIAEVKQMYTSGNFTQIEGDFYVKAKVTANDESANLAYGVYIEDETGGLRVNVYKPLGNSTTKSSLFQDARFAVGKNLIVKLNTLFIGKTKGEFQLGKGVGAAVGNVPESEIFKYFFDSKETSAVVATEKTIATLSPEDVGRYVKIKGVQFVDSDKVKTYAGSSVTDRTLEDCSGHTIPLRTRNYAAFAGAEVDGGKGDIYAIVSYENGTYYLVLPYQKNADFDNARCDGTVPLIYETIYSDGFNTLGNWTVVNVLGDRTWTTTTYGNPAPSAYIDGNRQLNEDWLIAKKVGLAGYKDAYFTFETDARYSGKPLEVYVTDNYTGTPSTTTWTKVEAALDTDYGAYAGFVSSGRVSLNAFIGKEVVVAFKYTSVSGASITYELDNFVVKGSR